MTITTVDARKRFSEILNRAAFGKERVILTRHGKVLAAVVPIEDIEMLEAMEDEIDVKEPKKVLARIDGGEEETIPWKQVKRELGLK